MYPNCHLTTANLFPNSFPLPKLTLLWVMGSKRGPSITIRQLFRKVELYFVDPLALAGAALQNTIVIY